MSSVHPTVDIDHDLDQPERKWGKDTKNGGLTPHQTPAQWQPIDATADRSETQHPVTEHRRINTEEIDVSKALDDESSTQQIAGVLAEQKAE